MTLLPIVDADYQMSLNDLIAERDKINTFIVAYETCPIVIKLWDDQQVVRFDADYMRGRLRDKHQSRRDWIFRQ